MSKDPSEFILPQSAFDMNELLAGLQDGTIRRFGRRRSDGEVYFEIIQPQELRAIRAVPPNTTIHGI